MVTDVVALSPGESASDVLLAVTGVGDVRNTKNGKQFLDATVVYRSDEDISRTFSLRIWDYQQVSDWFGPREIIRVKKVDVGKFNDKKQFTTEGKLVDQQLLDMDTYMNLVPGSYWPKDYLVSGINEYIQNLGAGKPERIPMGFKTGLKLSELTALPFVILDRKSVV